MNLPHLNMITDAHNRFVAPRMLSGTTRLSRYQKKHSPTHAYHRHQSSLICSSISCDPWHPPCSIYVPDSLFPQTPQVFFGLPLVLAPSVSYSIHFFIQLLSSFCGTCPYHRNLFWDTEYWDCHLILVSLSTLYLDRTATQTDRPTNGVGDITCTNTRLRSIDYSDVANNIEILWKKWGSPMTTSFLLRPLHYYFKFCYGCWV